jgi:gamma-glutamylcyclotransferase (GGCT)/AIG2-like uncharacterized protein YtfP
MFKVFVYGTLKPNQCNYSYYCQGKVTEQIKAFTKGKLYHLPTLGYPAITEGEGKVEGYLLTFFDDQVLANLDNLEDYHPDNSPEQNGYQRRLIMVYNVSEKPLGNAWAYFMEFEKIQALKGVLVPSGCWH